jgi:hypothetical protein
MKVKELIKVLSELEHVQFQLQDGTPVPPHFHVTEMGLILKNYVDCGGKMRNERWTSFQIWVAGDTEHRLSPSKFMGIISLCDGLYGMQDLDIVVEYQMDTIGLFDMSFTDGKFILHPKFTACLAEDACGIPEAKRKVSLSELNKSNACKPGGGCC